MNDIFRAIAHHKKQIEICSYKLETAKYKQPYLNRIRLHKEELKKLQPTLADYI